GKVGESGRVYGFDIQKTAIEITTEKLSKYGYIDRTILINDSHTKLDDYIKEQLDFAIYNLGFLPKGRKESVTNKKTTIESIKKALNLLKTHGILVVVSYIGHENGLDEYKAVYKYLSLLDQKKFNVLELNFINQINNPPRLFCVEVRGGK
ncbi:class I SAM-dependent methyltransferase, partial [Vibrio parahaemolyticus]|nr:class I SAM-dependent methyltransferase [Vibrio parahaemolyticus]